jgi:amino acid transporter
MSRKDDMPQKKKGISILNWMGTLVLCAIPGVNILALALMAGLAKSRSKRTFAGAALILIGIIVVLFVAAFLIFGDELVAFSQKLIQGI